MNDFIGITSDWGYLGCIGWVNKGAFSAPKGYRVHGITFLFQGWVTNPSVTTNLPNPLNEPKTFN